MIFFADGIGTIKDPPMSIKFKKSDETCFLKARSFDFINATELELERLINKVILKPIHSFKWTSKVEIVPKPDGTIRICVDCSKTVIAGIENDNYPRRRIK